MAQTGAAEPGQGLGVVVYPPYMRARSRDVINPYCQSFLPPALKMAILATPFCLVSVDLQAAGGDMCLHAGPSAGPVEAFLRMMQEAPPLEQCHSPATPLVPDRMGILVDGSLGQPLECFTVKQGLEQFQSLKSVLQQNISRH